MDTSGVKLIARQAAARSFPMQFITDFAGAVLDGETGELLEYFHLMKRPKYKDDWGYLFRNEVGRLFQGMHGRNDGTNTIFFYRKGWISWGRKKGVTYGKIMFNVWPQKDEVNRSRLTVGGDRINFEGDCSTPTANLLNVKLLLNSIVSMPGTMFLGLDLKDFYLNTPIDCPEYLKMKLTNFPRWCHCPLQVEWEGNQGWIHLLQNL